MVKRNLKQEAKPDYAEGSEKDKLLKKWLSVAESQICALEVLCSQIPKMNRVLEENMVALGNSFGVVASKSQEQQANLKNMIMEGRGKGRFPAMEKLSVEINSAISSAIVSMQFQDRVSQNLIIATNVSSEIMTYLKESVEITASVLQNSENTPLDEDFAKRLIKHLTLGELQHKFIQHLIEHSYIKDASQLGYSNEHDQKTPASDIELF